MTNRMIYSFLRKDRLCFRIVMMEKQSTRFKWRTLTVGPNTFGYCSVTRTGIFKILATVLSKAMLFVTVGERYISDSNLTWTSQINRAAVACLSRGIFTLREDIARPTRQDETMQKNNRMKRFKLLKFITACNPTRIRIALGYLHVINDAILRVNCGWHRSS